MKKLLFVGVVLAFAIGTLAADETKKVVYDAIEITTAMLCRGTAVFGTSTTKGAVMIIPGDGKSATQLRMSSPNGKSQLTLFVTDDKVVMVTKVNGREQTIDLEKIAAQ